MLAISSMQRYRLAPMALAAQSPACSVSPTRGVRKATLRDRPRRVSETPICALAASAAGYAEAATALNTRRAYRSAWRTFAAWCESQHVQALPAEATKVAIYLAARADSGRSVSSIQTDLAAIRKAHEVAGVATAVGGAKPTP